MSKSEQHEKAAVKSVASELVQATSVLRELVQKVEQLHASMVLLAKAQLCRESERDSKTVEDMAKAAGDYITSTIAIFERRLSTYIGEMRNTDKELNSKLNQLYEPLNNLTREVKSILGVSEGAEQKEVVGVKRSFLLGNMLEDTVKKGLETKRERFAEIYSEFENTMRDVENSLVDLKATLGRFSIKGVLNRPVVIGIPVLKVAVGKVEEHSVLAGDFSKYAERIRNYAVLNPKFGINADLYTSALEAVKQGKGLLYRLFLKLVVRCLK